MINPFLLYLTEPVSVPPTPPLAPSPPLSTGKGTDGYDGLLSWHSKTPDVDDDKIANELVPAIQVQEKEPKKRTRIEYNSSTSIEKAQKLTDAIDLVIANVENGELNCVGKVAKATGIPYNTLRDNYLKRTKSNTVSENKKKRMEKQQQQETEVPTEFEDENGF
jgi:hypothetical protein